MIPSFFSGQFGHNGVNGTAHRRLRVTSCMVEALGDDFDTWVTICCSLSGELPDLTEGTMGVRQRNVWATCHNRVMEDKACHHRKI